MLEIKKPHNYQHCQSCVVCEKYIERLRVAKASELSSEAVSELTDPYVQVSCSSFPQEEPKVRVYMSGWLEYGKPNSSGGARNLRMGETVVCPVLLRGQITALRSRLADLEDLYKTLPQRAV